MDIAEILSKYAKQYDTFYTLTNGEAQFHEVKNDAILLYDRNEELVEFNRYGELCCGGECLIFPSKEQRDWGVWVNEKRERLPLCVGDYVEYRDKQYVVETEEDEEGKVEICPIIGRGVITISSLLTKFCNKFDDKQLRPFDSVLVRDYDNVNWRADIFSHIRTDKGNDAEDYRYMCIDTAVRQCIPYNDETRGLVGTTEEAPFFYKL